MAEVVHQLTQEQLDAFKRACVLEGINDALAVVLAEHRSLQELCNNKLLTEQGKVVHQAMANGMRNSIVAIKELLCT